MTIIQDLIPAGSRNRPGTLCSRQSVTIHETDNTAKGADAKAHANYIKGADARSRGVSWHYTVDDHSIYRHLPDAERANHTGTEAGNNSSIGIELCVNSDGDFSKTVSNAVELTVSLCRQYGITADRVLQHHDWLRSANCPRRLRASGWAEFLQAVKEALPVSFTYSKLNQTHGVIFSPERFQVIDWRKGKRTTLIRDYACFPFQATGIAVVGNITANGKILARDPRLTTLWVTRDGKVGVSRSLPEDVHNSVSGFPLILYGRECTMAEALSEGWDTSPLYATTHSLLGERMDGRLQYLVFTTTAAGHEATFRECVAVARLFSLRSALLGDGGGSTILDIGGKNAIASEGNRQLAALIRF